MAAACTVSQSTLSASIQELEELLGAPLLERTKRSVVPTALGRKVADRARRLLKGAEDLMDVAQAARDPLFAGSRAEATTAQAEIERDQARVAARDARAVLARFWGGGPDFSLNLETFFQTDPPGDPGPLATADLALAEFLLGKRDA